MSRRHILFFFFLVSFNYFFQRREFFLEVSIGGEEPFARFFFVCLDFGFGTRVSQNDNQGELFLFHDSNVDIDFFFLDFGKTKSTRYEAEKRKTSHFGLF